MADSNDFPSCLYDLTTADPETALRVQERITALGLKAPPEIWIRMVEDTIWGLSQELSFGRVIADGYCQLIAGGDHGTLEKFHSEVRKAGEVGPTLGGLMALLLTPVLQTGNDLLYKRFKKTVEILLGKGAYTLKPALEALSGLLQTDDLAAGFEYLNVLRQVFLKDLTYSQAQHYSATLPRAVKHMPAAKRPWQISQLTRVSRLDLSLTDNLIKGLEQGLHLLTRPALDQFVTTGIERYRHHPNAGKTFLSLESKTGQDLFHQLQVNISTRQLLPVLNRYAQARTGRRLTVLPLSELNLPKSDTEKRPAYVCSDGRRIYLRDEIDDFPTQDQNIRLLKGLLRLELAQYEFATFDFDLEKLTAGTSRDGRQLPAYFNAEHLKTDIEAMIPDMVRFWQCFPDPCLAQDLMTIFEHGRLRLKLEKRYPGLVRQLYPLLREASLTPGQHADHPSPLLCLYHSIALNDNLSQGPARAVAAAPAIKAITADFAASISSQSTVEASARLVLRSYGHVREVKSLFSPFPALLTPYGIRLRPDLYHRSDLKNDLWARQLLKILAKKKIHFFKSDIKKWIDFDSGLIDLEKIEKLAIGLDPDAGVQPEPMQQIIINALRSLSDRFKGASHDTGSPGTAYGPAHRYKEWDVNLGDYLHQHVIVREQQIAATAADFYRDTLHKYSGLIKSIRYSFELLKPEGLKLLRRWREGDTFDYRALLDFAIDRKAGIMPSDRLYTKHLKQERDVGVLLLVDLSRSTANLVPGSESTVLAVEKEAIVLFCEALEVLGDLYAVAGFSGNGRLGVDFYSVKNFTTPLNDETRGKISAMDSKRSTRMGAAIRHATAQIDRIPARVKLLILIGDGFPNDVGYKKEYAVQDTRRAIQESLSKSIFVHAITVNVAGDTPLDELYGKAHHDIISDVRELPNKLLRIYSSLTKR